MNLATRIGFLTAVTLALGAAPGETNTPPARGERQNDRLRVGDPAVDFTLPMASGKGEVALSRFKGKKPVVLIFGSYT